MDFHNRNNYNSHDISESIKCIVNDIMSNMNDVFHYELLCILEKMFMNINDARYIIYLKSQFELLRESNLIMDTYDILRHYSSEKEVSSSIESSLMNVSLPELLLRSVLNEYTLLRIRNLSLGE